jgi:hypothetical protein
VKPIPFSEIDVPAAAMLEHETLNFASETEALNPAWGKVAEKHGFDATSYPAPPFLQTRYLSLLYLIVVFPRELSSSDLIREFVFKKVSNDLAGSVCVDLTRFDAFPQHLRNAISHANIRFLESGKVAFWDQKGGKINWQIELSGREIELVLKAFLNAYLEVRSTPHLRIQVTGVIQ